MTDELTETVAEEELWRCPDCGQDVPPEYTVATPNGDICTDCFYTDEYPQGAA